MSVSHRQLQSFLETNQELTIRAEIEDLNDGRSCVHLYDENDEIFDWMESDASPAWVEATMTELKYENFEITQAPMPEKIPLDEFYDWILENFELTGSSARLISNIIDYAKSQGWIGIENIHDYFKTMFDGTIGLTETDIERIKY